MLHQRCALPVTAVASQFNNFARIQTTEKGPALISGSTLKKLSRTSLKSGVAMAGHPPSAQAVEHVQSGSLKVTRTVSGLTSSMDSIGAASRW